MSIVKRIDFSKGLNKTWVYEGVILETKHWKPHNRISIRHVADMVLT